MKHNFSIAIGLVAILLLFPSVASAFAFSLSQVHSSPRIRATTAGTSTNWSGYAVTSSVSAVTDVQGSWVVPAVTGTSTNTYSSFWVGIDGYTSNTVEQIGTDSDYVNGAASYYAWYEFYPKGSYLITSVPVHAGDTMTAQVQYSSGVFTVSIADVSTGQNFHTSAKVPNAHRSSAEWIAEAPSSGGVLPLADFGTVSFDACYATIGGISDPISSFGSAVQSITMVDSSGSPIAIPSSLSDDGASFSVAYQTSTPGPISSGSPLGVTVSTDQSSYTQGSWAYITVTVTRSSSSSIAISGASVSLAIMLNGATVATGSGTTNSAGSVTFRYRISPHASTGTYTAAATATASGYSPGLGSATFKVT